MRTCANQRWKGQFGLSIYFSMGIFFCLSLTSFLARAVEPKTLLEQLQEKPEGMLLSEFVPELQKDVGARKFIEAIETFTQNKIRVLSGTTEIPGLAARFSLPTATIILYPCSNHFEAANIYHELADGFFLTQTLQSSNPNDFNDKTQKFLNQLEPAIKEVFYKFVYADAVKEKDITKFVRWWANFKDKEWRQL